MPVETAKLAPRKVGVPEWKKFWIDRGFANDMKYNGIVDEQLPDVIRRIFQTGPYCMLVVNYGDMSFSYSSGVMPLLGYHEDEIRHGKFEFLVSLLHPEDKEKVLGLSVHYYRFLDTQPVERQLDFKVSINFRLRRADGTYVRLLEQVIGLRQNQEGKVTHALKYFTDLSHLNYSNEVVLAILDDKGAEGQRFFTFDLEDKVKPISKSIFTDRQQEILVLIVQGKTTKEIAASLGISVFTINKHRENMMQKTGSKNLNEVISFAYCNEYL